MSGADAASLLPQHSTDTERAIEAALRAILPPEPRFADAWSAEDCPEALLPYLAAALSVDAWDPAWPEARRRETIRRAVPIHRRKGTLGSLEAALAPLGLDVHIAEWWQDGGAPNTIRVNITAAALLTRDVDAQRAAASEVHRIVRDTRPVHVSFAVRLGETRRPAIAARAGTRARACSRLVHRPGHQIVARPTIQARTGTRTRHHSRLVHRPAFPETP